MRTIQCITLLVHLLSAAGEGLRLADTEHRSLQSAATLTLNSKSTKYAFGSSIKVTFNNTLDPNPNSYPYFAVFKDEGITTLSEIPSWDFFIAWLNDCNSQADCVRDPENPLTIGTVEFSANDPKEAYYYDYYGYEYGRGYFPFRDGKYVVCFINEIYPDGGTSDVEEDPYETLITDCVRFHVRKPKKKMLQKAKVIPKPRLINYGADIVAKFKSPVPVPNQWIAVYNAKNAKVPTTLDDECLLWGYTSCATQLGNKNETTNCDRKWKKGKVTLNGNNFNAENAKAIWPLPRGNYYLCMHFHANEPYDKFKCAKTFITVK